jgi:hypothetical protein
LYIPSARIELAVPNSNPLGLPSRWPGLRRTARAPAWLEIATCLAGSVALALVTFWPQLRHGGFYSDDWSIGADAHFEKPTYFGAVHKTFHETGGRPVLAALFPLGPRTSAVALP